MSRFATKNSRFYFTGNFGQAPGTWALLAPAKRRQSIRFTKFPVIFPDKREFGRRDGFASDCILAAPSPVVHCEPFDGFRGGSPTPSRGGCFRQQPIEAVRTLREGL